MDALPASRHDYTVACSTTKSSEKSNDEMTVNPLADIKYHLMGGGNDKLGVIQLTKTPNGIEMSASSSSTPMMKYVLLAFVVAFFCISLSWYLPSSRLLSLEGLLLLSPLLLWIFFGLWATEKYVEYRESKMLPLLRFTGDALSCVRGNPTDLKSDSIALVLIHAFRSHRGEVVELQVHTEESSPDRRLVLSEITGCQYELKKHVIHLGETLEINTYFVKTDGPQGARPFRVRSVEPLTTKGSSRA